MKLERAPKDLQVLGNRVLALIGSLSDEGPTPREKDDWYTSRIGKHAWIFVRFNGRQTAKSPRNAAVFFTRWHDSLKGTTAIMEDDGYWGRPGALFFARAGVDEDFEAAAKIIRQVSKLHRGELL